MGKLYSGTILSLYGQVGIWDVEDTTSYPQWVTGLENAVIGPKGIAIATKADTLVDITISTDTPPELPEPLLQGYLFVGSKGLQVGNVPAAQIVTLDIQRGQIHVSVYANGFREEVTEISIFLKG